MPSQKLSTDTTDLDDRDKSRIAESCDAWQRLALQKLQRSTATSAAMADLVFGVVLLARGSCVTASNHSNRACSSCLDYGVHQRLRPYLKLGHLEDTHRSVPNDGLRCLHCRGIQFNGLWPTIQAHKTIRDACFLCCVLDLAILTKFRRDREVYRQDDLHTKFLRFLHDLRHNLGTFLIIPH